MGQVNGGVSEGNVSIRIAKELVLAVIRSFSHAFQTHG